MSPNEHEVQSLETAHAALEEDPQEFQSRPAPDEAREKWIHHRKLEIKDRVEELRRTDLFGS